MLASLRWEVLSQRTFLLTSLLTRPLILLRTTGMMQVSRKSGLYFRNRRTYLIFQTISFTTILVSLCSNQRQRNPSNLLPTMLLTEKVQSHGCMISFRLSRLQLRRNSLQEHLQRARHGSWMLLLPVILAAAGMLRMRQAGILQVHMRRLITVCMMMS